jgi:hypothetical protein
MLFDIVLLREQRTIVGPSAAASVEKDRREARGGCSLQYTHKHGQREWRVCVLSRVTVRGRGGGGDWDNGVSQSPKPERQLH